MQKGGLVAALLSALSDRWCSALARLLRLTTAARCLLGRLPRLAATTAFSAWRRRLLLLPEFTAAAPGCARLLPATTTLGARRLP